MFKEALEVIKYKVLGPVCVEESKDSECEKLLIFLKPVCILPGVAVDIKPPTDPSILSLKA